MEQIAGMAYGKPKRIRQRPEAASFGFQFVNLFVHAHRLAWADLFRNSRNERLTTISRRANVAQQTEANMVRTIYRGYDITSETPGSWKVFNPKNQGQLAEFGSEDAAMNFVDKHKREQAKELAR